METPAAAIGEYKTSKKQQSIPTNTQLCRCSGRHHRLIELIGADLDAFYGKKDSRYLSVASYQCRRSLTLVISHFYCCWRVCFSQRLNAHHAYLPLRPRINEERSVTSMWHSVLGFVRRLVGSMDPHIFFPPRWDLASLIIIHCKSFPGTL